MKSGPITDGTTMKLKRPAMLVLAAALALSPGCERKAATDTAPAKPAATAKTDASKQESDPAASMGRIPGGSFIMGDKRSEEHTSELQSLRHLVCRLLLE